MRNSAIFAPSYRAANTALDLFEVDVLAIEQDLANLALVLVDFGPINRHRLASNLTHQTLFRDLAKSLAFFRRIDARQPDFVLDTRVIQNRDGVAIGNVNDFAQQSVSMGLEGQQQYESK